MGRTGTISPGPSHKSSPYARLRSMSSLTQLAGRAVTVCVQVVLVSGRSGYRTRQVRAIHIIDAVVEPVAGGWGRRRGRRGFGRRGRGRGGGHRGGGGGGAGARKG